MKKRLMLALLLILCAALLAGCTGDKQKFNVLSSTNGGQQNQEQPADPAQEEDPLAEEDDYGDDWNLPDPPTPPQVTPTPAPTVRSEYAGATPVVLDPIDKPTPTAVPKLEVAYTPYDAIKVGLSFEGPAGWMTDESAAENVFTIMNPNARMDYMAFLTLTTEKVDAEYTVSNLKSVVGNMLDAIENSGMASYDPSQTAERTLLGKPGVYANYTGALEDGTQVAGRVHVVCVDKVLYTLHLSAPRAQWNEYKELVYDKLRDTIAIIK